MSQYFKEQLEQLNNRLIEMGGLVEYAISSTLQALVTQNAEMAQKLIDFGSEIDKKEREIEGICLRLLLQQPLAGDLRQISSALKMITDMERIGDQCEEICSITLSLVDEKYYEDPVHVPQMAEAATKMVKDAIEAYVKQDLLLAKSVVLCDDIVDDLFVTVRSDVIELIRQNTEYGEQAISLIMIAKYFERIGDHAANIAEWVIYAITGVHKSEELSGSNGNSTQNTEPQ